MRPVAIEFRGSLRDFAAASVTVTLALPVGLRDLIQSRGVPHVEVETVLVNGQAAPWEHRIEGGERIVAVSRYPLPKPPGDARFVLDGHLGTLARDLRLLGIDTWYRRAVDDVELATLSVETGRTLLTRDLGLLMRAALRSASYVRTTDPDEQIIEMLGRFRLRELVEPFRRCLACNGVVVAATQAEAAARVDPDIATRFASFRRCPDCGRIYWEGSHHRRLAARVATILTVGDDQTNGATSSAS